MLHILRHPLADHWLAALRSAETPPEAFRALVRRLSVALLWEATRELPTESFRVRTPLVETDARRLSAPPLLVPVLRAGLGMAEAVLDLLPDAPVCHLGLYRDHRTLAPVRYYVPQPPPAVGRCALVLDPMLGTGGSAVEAIRIVQGWGAAPVRLLGLIGAPEGAERVRAAYPEVEIYLAALDSHLNEVGYIVPGLGDAGDRQFGPTGPG